MPTLAENIRLARQRARLTQSALAKRAGLQQNMISSWESEKSQPSTGSLLSVAVALNVSVDRLLAGISPKYDRLLHALHVMGDDKPYSDVIDQNFSTPEPDEGGSPHGFARSSSDRREQIESVADGLMALIEQLRALADSTPAVATTPSDPPANADLRGTPPARSGLHREVLQPRAVKTRAVAKRRRRA